MKKPILIALLFLGAGFTACDNHADTKSQTEKSGTANQTLNKEMKNLASIIEIPVADLTRAIAFYETILEVSIEKMEMDGVQMGVLPSDGKTVSVVLAKGDDYKPTTDGALVYLNAGADLQTALDKVAQNGGKIVVPKTAISPEMGYFALFIDTEGNKLGLHSSN